MKPELILGIIGTFGTFALLINGYFLRGIFQDLNEVKIQLAGMSENSKAKEDKIEKLEEAVKDIYKKLHNIERKI